MKQLIDGRTGQPTAGFTLTCLQTEVKDHPAILRMTYGQSTESLSRGWLSKLELLLKVKPTQIPDDDGLAPIS